MSRKAVFVAIASIVAMLSSVAASATETITCTYDARGRMIKVVSIGSVNNNNNQTCYKVGKADNRTNVQATVGSLPACP